MLMEELISQERQSSSSVDALSADFRHKLMDLEGQCKIKQILLLKINYAKAIVLTILLTISILGLFLLKNYIKLRTIVFYTILNEDQIQQSTHIYVKSQEDNEQISNIVKINFNQRMRFVFQFKRLKYEIIEKIWLPLGFPYINKIGQVRSQKFLSEGLTKGEIKQRQEFYGKNEHRVQVPGYFEFLFDTMTKPFFIFQYFVSIIYFLENTQLFALLMVAFGFITTSINYVLLKRSYNRIKQTAQKIFKVKVYRNGSFEEIDNVDLVPGDIYEPRDQIPCDSIMVKGDLFLDEVNLTGENVPIAKFKIIDNTKHNDKSHWLFQGSNVQTIKQHSLALAVHVGYSSQRGRIIRKILTKVSKQPEFFTKLIYFQIEVMIISFVIYFLSLPQLLSLDIDSIMVAFRFGDFVTYSFPAPFPIFFNLAYSFCLVRLNKEGIMGTQAEKTVQSSRMKTICFDKTGTLTLNNMQISNVFHFKDTKTTQQITQDTINNELISILFGSCNSVQEINGQVKGDQIDLRMFEHVNCTIHQSKALNILRQLHINNQIIQVIKINQYQSQFQSMSVIVKNLHQNKFYVFAKGSPEMIHKYSTKKINDYDNFIKKLSFSGFRCIGFGFKQIRQEQIANYMVANRQAFLINIEILGVTTFINKLKEDAKQTVSTLTQCDINTKIITGDNIFLGIQTAIMIGMISQQANIIVLEGKKYNKRTNSMQILQLSRNEDKTIKETTRFVQSFQYEYQPNVVYAIDNDFIKENPNNFMHDRVKVFARISPENKALIVRRHKQIIQAEMQKRKGWKKLFGECSSKVGMIGDGANDLIAIKQADVGIGISSSDAVYSASFSIKELIKIIQIIKQSKNTERQIVEMTKYYGLTQFTSIVVTLICSTDASYFTGFELIYKSFLSTLIITLLLGMTKPPEKLTKYLNNSNMIDLEHHLVFWITMAIYTAGLIISYAYYYQTDDFEPNPHPFIRFPEGWEGETKSSTLNFLTSNILYITLPFAIYRSSPWKLPIWTNKPVIGVVILNVLLLLPICYLTSYLSAFSIQPIGRNEITIVIGIMLIAFAVVLAVNKIIERIFMNRIRKRAQNTLVQEDQLDEK